MTPAASFTLLVIIRAIFLALAFTLGYAVGITLGQLSAPSPVSQGASQGGAPLRIGRASAGIDRPVASSRETGDKGPDGAARDAASEDTRQASPAEFDLATGSGKLGGAPFQPAAALPSASAHDVSMPAPSPTGEVGTVLLGGFATWFDTCARCAAAGPALRSMLGSGWRGMVVTVDGPGGTAVTAKLTDWCACGERHGRPTLIDLSRDAFAELVHPSAGVVAVSIEYSVERPSVTLPPTSTEAD